MSKGHFPELSTADLRAAARTMFQSAVAAADPARAVRRHLCAEPFVRASAGGKTYLLAIGKAAPAMMAEALLHVPDKPRDRSRDCALVVTHSGNMPDTPGCRTIMGDHPVPGANSLLAGREVMEFVSRMRVQDQLVALISGGGSALLAAPAAGISLEEKAAVTHMMLSQGFDISEINLVRQHLSELKGGKLAALAAPAGVRTLILSDVIGNDVRAIASGLTTGALGTCSEARKLLRSRGFFKDLPEAVRRVLASRSNDAQNDTTTVEAAVEAGVEVVVIGSNRLSLEAALESARAMGWPATIVSDCLTGDVAKAAQRILVETRAMAPGQRRALIFGGETTVVVQGPGKGGRNQELALRVALSASQMPRAWVFLSGGTDGRDGPTDAAGGLIDQGTLARMRAAGIEPAAYLAYSNSYAALRASGDLLKTGPTGTNVADVQIMLLGGKVA